MIPGWTDLLPELVAFLGCDYIDRTKNYGYGKIVKSLLPSYREAENKRLYLHSLTTAIGTPEDYADAFLRATNLYRYAPVMKRMDDGSLGLYPLHEFDDQNMAPVWGDLIGFGSHPSTLLGLQPDQYVAASKFKGCSFKHGGGSLMPSPTPSFTAADTHIPSLVGRPLPHFARLDFEAIPIQCVPLAVLRAFTQAHGAVPKETKQLRKELTLLRSESTRKTTMTACCCVDDIDGIPYENVWELLLI